MQKRICFTELDPKELAAHATKFGPFAFEWDISTLIEMGAIPCFYVPLKGTPGSYDGTASAMLARLGEVQELLVRLENMDATARNASDTQEVLKLTRNGEVIGEIQCTVGAARDLLDAVQGGIQPLSALTAAVRALSGFFYPTDHPTYTDLLGYYRQREWKLLANLNHRGVPVTVPVDQQDVAALLDIDTEFFGRELEFPTGRKSRVSQCQLYKTFRGVAIVNSVRRVICPREVIAEVSQMLEANGARLNVVAIESFAAA
jgi:hypothetical protein